MSLTAQQIKLVQGSFAKVAPIADTAAQIFYATLFKNHPQVRSLFKGDMKEQGKKLMSVLGFAVGALTNLDTLVPALHSLAERHVGYGVTETDYGPVGSALLDTLAQGLGPDFTDETRAAWAEVYQLIADTMCAHVAKG